MARRRQLRPEEHDLWQAVARTARPLHGATLPHPVVVGPVAAPATDTKKHASIPAFRVGEKTPHFRKDDALPGPGIQMDAKAFARCQRASWPRTHALICTA